MATTSPPIHLNYVDWHRWLPLSFVERLFGLVLLRYLSPSLHSQLKDCRYFALMNVSFASRSQYQPHFGVCISLHDGVRR